MFQTLLIVLMNSEWRRTTNGSETDESSGPDWPRWRCWRKTNCPQTKDSCKDIKTLPVWTRHHHRRRHCRHHHLKFLIFFKCFFSSKNTLRIQQKDLFSSNSTNYKVKPSGVKVRLMFSSNFKIILNLVHVRKINMINFKFYDCEQSFNTIKDPDQWREASLVSDSGD